MQVYLKFAKCWAFLCFKRSLARAESLYVLVMIFVQGAPVKWITLYHFFMDIGFTDHALVSPKEWRCLEAMSFHWTALHVKMRVHG